MEAGHQPETAKGTEFLPGGGEIADLVRSKDWSKTPLGPITDWPQSLKTTVSLCLASNFPINIIWGDQHTQIYNDGYRVVCGEAHPAALGQNYRETWASAWPAVGEPFENALAGNTSFLENQRMFLTRNGYLEETFFTFSTSPVRDETGDVVGLFHPVTETTSAMLAERRTRSLRDLNAALGPAKDLADIARLSIETLSGFDLDLPFLLFYELVPSVGYRLVGSHGLEAGCAAAPTLLDLSGEIVWPVAKASETGATILIPDVKTKLAGAPCGPYEEPPRNAFLLPIMVPNADRPVAIVVAGVSPRLPLDDRYTGYYELLCAALAAAVSTARAREDERRQVEALAEIDRAKTLFFSNVSHEFRTPLTLMLGPLEDLLSQADRLSPDDRENIALAHRNGLRLLKLVNSLLDFSRIEAGRMRARFEASDLAKQTAELASNFRSATDRAGLTLTVEAEPLGQPVYIDRGMWENVVLNLISNAFKFTLSGEIRVAVRPSADGQSAQLSVSDTGTGIPSDQLPYLFERFRRVEGAAGRSFEGSGIGLALVQELVRLHGGEVSVTSTPGQGSTFSVAIPFGMAHLPVDQVVTAPDAAPLPSRANAFVQEALSWLPATDDAAPTSQDDLPAGNGGRILVADDNADMRDYIVRLLREADFQVDAVADGDAALRKMREVRPDLLLSDVMMPGMSGFDLLAAVRADPLMKDTSVILLSARSGEEARVEGLEAGADDYLTKPFAARELVARVASEIGLAKGRRSTQDALRHAQKMEAIGQLTGGIAHDFNNLLMMLSGGLEMLDRQTNPDRRQRIFTGMQQAVDRGASLTKQLLGFSRRQALKPRSVGLRNFLERQRDLLDRTLSGAIAVEAELQDGLWPVEVDPNELELALINLCVNARDAMAGSGTIRVRADNIDGPQPHVRLRVTDTGQGMSPEVLARVFEPFFTTKDVGKGSGLGLAQVYAFAQSTGGSITIDSAPGKGTTVTLLLPRSDREPDGEVTELPRAARPAKPASGQLLLVEDDEEVAIMVAEMLGQLGYTVSRVASAAAALGALADGREIDLVFSDIMMPGGMNGLELAREIKRRRPGLRVVLTSGYAATARAEAEAEGMPILAKPYQLDDLAAALEGKRAA
ncbi:MAG: ATP-binding protein [Sphingobium sp.]